MPPRKTRSRSTAAFSSSSETRRRFCRSSRTSVSRLPSRWTPGASDADDDPFADAARLRVPDRRISELACVSGGPEVGGERGRGRVELIVGDGVASDGQLEAVLAQDVVAGPPPGRQGLLRRPSPRPLRPGVARMNLQERRRLPRRLAEEAEAGLAERAEELDAAADEARVRRSGPRERLARLAATQKPLGLPHRPAA